MEAVIIEMGGLSSGVRGPGGTDSLAPIDWTKILRGLTRPICTPAYPLTVKECWEKLEFKSGVIRS